MFLSRQRATTPVPQDIWFLNDLGVVDGGGHASGGRGALLTSQFGPTRRPLITKHLWRCQWNESEIRADGRLPSDCVLADPAASIGLNGMNVNRVKSVVWANDLFLSRLWVWDRDTETGELTRRADLELPGVIDNVEYDSSSGGKKKNKHISFDWGHSTTIPYRSMPCPLSLIPHPPSSLAPPQ